MAREATTARRTNAPPARLRASSHQSANGNSAKTDPPPDPQALDRLNARAEHAIERATTVARRIESIGDRAFGSSGEIGGGTGIDVPAPVGAAYVLEHAFEVLHNALNEIEFQTTRLEKL